MSKIRGQGPPFSQACSIGLVTRHANEDVTALMHPAAEPLYQAKIRGRDRIVAAA